MIYYLNEVFTVRVWLVIIYTDLTILKCSYHINIEYIWSYVLRIVFAGILRLALSSRLAPSLKRIALIWLFGVGGILPEARW